VGAAGTRLVLLLAAVLALVLGLFTAGTGSASGLPAAGTRVGTIHPTVTTFVGVHECIRAGQRPVRGPSQSQIVSGNCVAAEDGAAALNGAGRAYPRVLDPRSGEPITNPGGGLSKVPVGDRVPWGGQERGAYIKDWYDRGYSTPEGGWGGYDIHHITPREYGGTNDFDNLVPVPRSVHQDEFNSWWRDY